MNKYDIQKLRELPIESVAERLGLRVSRHKALCPFHADSHPSLSFSVAKNTFKCFVCDAHGGTIDLAMKVLNKDFPQACDWLANEHNIILEEWKPAEKPTPSKGFDASKYLRFFEHPYLNEAATNFLYNQRHLDSRVVQWCKLNSFTDRKGIPWLQIPYYDVDGKLIGVQSRNLGNDKNQPRFKFPYGSKCPIYNLPVMKMLKPNEPLFITEGASDCWAMLSSGHKSIAIPSATLLNKKDIQIMESLKPLGVTLHMYPDADIPGERLYLELTRLATDLGLCLARHTLPSDCKDYSAYYLQSINHKP